MTRFALPWLAVVATLLLLDGVWLGAIAMPLYERGIGHLMAPTPNFAAAGLFYLLYAAGILAFVVRSRARGDRRGTALWGAAFGVVAYMTYDLTNLATLRDWPIGLSLLDTAWGALATAIAATVGRIVADRRAG